MTNYLKEYLESPSLLSYNKNKVELANEKVEDPTFLNCKFNNNISTEKEATPTYR
jgi:hypothetical protein